MKSFVSSRCILLILPLLVCLSSLHIVTHKAAYAAGNGSFLFECSLSDAELSLLLPMNVSYQFLSDTPEQKALLLSIPQFPSSHFIFFATKNDTGKRLIFNGMSEYEINDVVQIISDQPETATYELIENFHDNKSALRIIENTTEAYKEHIVAEYDQWILNLIVERFDGVSSLTESERAMQYDILYNCLKSDTQQARLQYYTIPNTGISLTVPQNMHINLRTDELDSKCISIVNSDTDQAPFTLYAVYDDRYVGKTIHMLTEDERKQAMLHFVPDMHTISEIQDEMIVNDIPVVMFESQNPLFDTVTHYIALRDGWAISIVYAHTNDTDSACAIATQTDLMRILLGGKAESPVFLDADLTTFNNGILRIPLNTKVLKLAVPAEYDLDIDVDYPDEKVFYIFREAPSKYLRVAFYLNEAGELLFSDMRNQANIKKMGEQATSSLTDITGAKANYTLIDAGMLGKPAIHITNEEKICESYIFYTDTYIIDASLMSLEEPITEQESDALLNLLSFE